MKKIILLILISLSLYAIANAQLDDILKKTTKEVTKGELFEEQNVTTSITDAFPVAFWLKNLSDYREPIEPENYDFQLEPGYYSFRVQSYCLKAGTYGPAKGSGYLLAPLKGKRSDLVYNVISRSAEHPEIAQHDIQIFLWGIIAGVKFTNYDIEFQNKIRPLLTPADIAELSLDLKNVPLEVMPDEIKRAAQYYADLRKRLTDPGVTYNQLEQVTMLSGYLPDEPFSKYVEKGLWAYIGDGFYARGLPEAYYTMILEIYRPAFINLSRDAKDRVVSLERDGNKIDIIYDDEQGRDVFTANGQDYPVWRFKQIKFTGTNPEEALSLDNAGWMIRGNGLPVKNKGGAYKDNERTDNEPTLSEYNQRMADFKADVKNFNEYRKQKGIPLLKGTQSFENTQNGDWADEHMYKGFKAATDPIDKKGQLNWLRIHFSMASDWWSNASGALAGGEDNKNNNRRKPDFSRAPSVPATNGAQRLISSQRKQSN